MQPDGDIKFIVCREVNNVPTTMFGPFDTEAAAKQWGNSHYGPDDPNWGIFELYSEIREEHTCYL